MKPCWFDW